MIRGKDNNEGDDTENAAKIFEVIIAVVEEMYCAIIIIYNSVEHLCVAFTPYFE